MAASVTWDTLSGDGAVNGGVGTWDASTANWTADAGVNNLLWNNSNNDVAVFGGTGGSITLAGPITAGGLTFSAAGYTLAGDALNLGGATNVVQSDAAATINSVIAGTAELVKLGAANLTLGAKSTFTGLTRIGNTATAGGTLTLAVDDAIADSAGLRFGGPDTTAATAILALGGTNQAVKSLQVSFGPSAGQTAAATITGTGTLTVSGASDLIVAHNGAGSQPTTGDAIAHLNLSGLANFEYTAASNKVLVQGGATANNRAGRLTLGASSSFTALSFDVHNVTAPSGDVRRSDVFLGNANTINANTVNVLTGNSKDSAGIAFRSGLAAGPTLKIRGTGGLDANRANINIGTTGTATNSGTGTGIIDLNTNATTSVLDAMVGTLQIGSRSAGSNTHNATFSMARGTLDATTINLGTISSGGLNSTFSLNGGTVKASTLNFGTRTSGTLTSVFNLNGGGTLAAASINNSGTATRSFNWNDGTLKNYDSSTDLSIAAGVSLKLASSGTHAIDVNEARKATVSSVLSDATTGGTLVKNGLGILELAAVNTYTGATTVSAGTLLVTGALGNTAVSVAAGATVGGTGVLGGTLAFDGGSFLTIPDIADPLSVSGAVTFGSGFGIDNIRGLDWDSLALDTPYTLISSTQDFSSAGLDHFGLANAANVGSTGRKAYFQTGSLQLMVIPEPSVFLLGGIGLVALARRRRI